mgnify:CR=1 FL=1
MAGPLTDIGVAARLAARTLGRRVRSGLEAEPDIAAFRQRMQSLVSRIPEGLVQSTQWLDMPATRPPWIDAGVAVELGDELTYFTVGRVYASRALDIHIAPALQVWCRIGEHGEVFRGTRATHSWRAESAGRLYFGNYFPNDWRDRQGQRKQDDKVYNSVSGGVGILVIKWRGSALDGLKAWHALVDDETVAGEIERLQQPATTPAGWDYLWHLGPAEIYRSGHTDDSRPCISCHTHSDVGILQRDVDLPLTRDTTISWRWCVEQLPSTIREDSLPSHDYLSIAIEFDDGRDITYYWSAELPVEAGYDCPLPNWAGIEYHVVVRSGREGLGTWQQEQRNLFEDYRRYMGAPPARVTRIWLIANSIFQRGDGRCQFADIKLHQGREPLQVL